MPYKDKGHAMYAIRKIQNEHDGRKKPVRVYDYPLWSAWYLTSKLLDGWTDSFYKPILDWSKFLNK